MVVINHNFTCIYDIHLTNLIVYVIMSITTRFDIRVKCVQTRVRNYHKRQRTCDFFQGP